MKNYFTDHNNIAIKRRISLLFPLHAVFLWVYYSVAQCTSINRRLVQSLHIDSFPIVLPLTKLIAVKSASIIFFTHWSPVNCLLHDSSPDSVVWALALSCLSLAETRSCSYEVRLAEILERTYANSAEEWLLPFIKTLTMLFVFKWGRNRTAIRVFQIYNVSQLRMKLVLTQIIM